VVRNDDGGERVVLRKEEKKHSRHASSYNSRLVLHYWGELKPKILIKSQTIK